MDNEHTEQGSRSDDDRRAFLKACGRFAVVTPATVTVLLSTSLTSGAIAHSGDGGGSHSDGQGGGFFDSPSK